jgi:hypothetical protein
VCHATRGFATKSQRLTTRCSQATFPLSVLRNSFQDGSIEDYVEAYTGRSTVWGGSAVVLRAVAGSLLTLQLALIELSAEWLSQVVVCVRPARRGPLAISRHIPFSVSWPLQACGGRCPGRVRRRLQARQPSWPSPVANVIHAPAIDRQHLGCDEAGIRLDQESHGGGNVLRRANPTDHGALAH